MIFQYHGLVSGALKRLPICFQNLGANVSSQSRQLHSPPRQRLANFWIPHIATHERSEESQITADRRLVDTGYIRQAYSGIFHMLPLGLRVQNKLETLIDKHMQSISASKVSLSSITSQKLWEESGRLDNNSEFFRFQDRKDAKWLLAPTHEEEITSLVKKLVSKSDDLPVRLYQVSRKYRDEKRPRGGLLRGREFLMKDLYTFDRSESDAHATYEQVRQAYNNLFSELKIPYVEARADSGNMGGTKSHEFHFPSKLGEDVLIECSKCDYAKNEEYVPPLKVSAANALDSEMPAQASKEPQSLFVEPLLYQAFVSRDKRTLVKVLYSKKDHKTDTTTVNSFVVKKSLSEYADIDTGIESPEKEWSQQGSSTKGIKQLYYLFDDSISVQDALIFCEKDTTKTKGTPSAIEILRVSAESLDKQLLVRKQEGDLCPDCASNGKDGRLRTTKAIEVAHTFNLGTRYSSKLDFPIPGASKTEKKFVQMGCHGIGVSRLMAAAASALSDHRGLIWPRVIAPFEVVIMTLHGRDKHKTLQAVANEIYDNLTSDHTNPVDAIIDDRDGPGPGWKFRDAELIGYPVTMSIGGRYPTEKLVEIECRQLDLREKLPLEKAVPRVREILAQL